MLEAASATAAFFSTSRMLSPSAFSRAMMAKIFCTSTGDRPSEGSSSSSRRGRAIKVRAISSICCSPPDKVLALWRSRRSRAPAGSGATLARPAEGDVRGRSGALSLARRAQLRVATEEMR